MIGVEPKTLSDWQKILEKLGFVKDDRYYFIDNELSAVDWFKDKEHIVTNTCYSKEFSDYLDTLPEGSSFEIDFAQLEVHTIKITTKEFGYPEAEYTFDGTFIGNIELSDNSFHKNFSSLSLDYFLKALWMSRNPIKAKNEIVRKYISEVDTFIKKHGDMLKRLGFREKGDDILLVGYGRVQTEPFIEYYHDNIYRLGGISFSYNMFTEKLYYTKLVKLDKGRTCYEYHQLNVNDITPEELESELIEHLKLNNVHD